MKGQDHLWRPDRSDRARPRALALPIESYVLLYLLAYVPYVIVVRLITDAPHPAMGRALSGLEILPASLIICMVLTWAFIWASGWHRDANRVMLGRLRLPCPTLPTFLSGLGSSMVLFTVPLSFTIPNVSIPFLQLVMRGDVLILATLVDMIFGRRVHWWSWVALGLVLLAMAITVSDRGGLNLPPMASLTIAIYTIGFFLRLSMMTKVSKSGDPATVRRYFVEEKMVALPLSIACLGVMAASGVAGPSSELAWGFVHAWTDPALGKLLLIGAMLTVISVLSIVILLDPRENAYCIALERAASLVAGIAGSAVLAWIWGLGMPRPAEFAGGVVLIGAIGLLSVAPRLAASRQTQA